MKRENIYLFVATFWIDLLQVTDEERLSMIEKLVPYIKAKMENEPRHHRIYSFTLLRAWHNITDDLKEMLEHIGQLWPVKLPLDTFTELWFEKEKLKCMYRIKGGDMLTINEL